MSLTLAFPPRTSAVTSRLVTQIREAQEANDLATFVHRADERLGRVESGGLVGELANDRQRSLRRRAAIAIRLGDPVKAGVVVERAGLAIIRDIQSRIDAGQLTAGEPETAIDLTTARQLAKVALLAGLDYLGDTSGHLVPLRLDLETPHPRATTGAQKEHAMSENDDTTGTAAPAEPETQPVDQGDGATTEATNDDETQDLDPKD